MSKEVIGFIVWMVLNIPIPALVIGAWFLMSPDGFWQQLALIASSVILAWFEFFWFMITGAFIAHMVE